MKNAMKNAMKNEDYMNKRREKNHVKIKRKNYL